MRNSKFKLLGMILALSSLSACGVKKSSSNDNNQGSSDALNIQGTTSWLMDVMIPSSYADDSISSEATCPDGFYASPIINASSESETTANSSSACPNIKTTCESESGTCAFLYSISETEGKKLICTVPVDKHNHYEFKFSESPGITAGQIVITSPAASSIVIPNSCMAENSGIEKKYEYIEKSEKYECLPNPVEYREITFEVTDKQIVANADPDATLESGFNSAILQTPSETLREHYKKAKEEALAEIKKTFGDKIDFNDTNTISNFVNSIAAEDQLNSIVLNSGNLDLEKVKKEFEGKMVLDKIDSPEKLSHYEKNNSFIKDLVSKKAAELPDGDAEKEKLTAIQDELNGKIPDIKEKAVDLQFEGIKDPSKIDKRKQKEIAELIGKIEKSTSAVVAAASGEAVKQLAETGTCSLEDDAANAGEFDLDTHLSEFEKAHSEMLTAKLEKRDRAWKTASMSDEKRGQLHDSMNELLSMQDGNPDLIEKISVVEKDFLAALDQRNQDYGKALDMNLIESIAKAKFVESHMNAYQMALEQLQTKIAVTTNEDELKLLNELAENYTVIIKDDAAALPHIANDIKYSEFKIKIEKIYIKMKRQDELNEYYNIKSKVMTIWNDKDSTLGLTSLISDSDSKIKDLEIEKEKTEQELNETQKAFDDFRGSLS